MSRVQRQPFKSPLSDLQRTTETFGLDGSGGDDGDASDATSRLQNPPSEHTHSLFE